MCSLSIIGYTFCDPLFLGLTAQVTIPVLVGEEIADEQSVHVSQLMDDSGAISLPEEHDNVIKYVQCLSSGNTKPLTVVVQVSASVDLAVAPGSPGERRPQRPGTDREESCKGRLCGHLRDISTPSLCIW